MRAIHWLAVSLLAVALVAAVMGCEDNKEPSQEDLELLGGMEPGAQPDPLPGVSAPKERPESQDEDTEPAPEQTGDEAGADDEAPEAATEQDPAAEPSEAAPADDEE